MDKKILLLPGHASRLFFCLLIIFMLTAKQRLAIISDIEGTHADDEPEEIFMNTYEIYKTDHGMTVTGGGWTVARWQDIDNNMSANEKQPAGYAVYTAKRAAMTEIIMVSVEQGRNLHERAYQTTQIEDIDGRIERALQAVESAIKARNEKIAAQGNTTTYQCIEQGCQARVSTRGTRCTRCQHDED